MSLLKCIVIKSHFNKGMGNTVATILKTIPAASLFMSLLIRCETFFMSFNVLIFIMLVLNIICTDFLGAVGLYDEIMFLFKRFIIENGTSFYHVFISTETKLFCELQNAFVN